MVTLPRTCFKLTLATEKKYLAFFCFFNHLDIFFEEQLKLNVKLCVCNSKPQCCVSHLERHQLEHLYAHQYFTSEDSYILAPHSGCIFLQMACL